MQASLDHAQSLLKAKDLPEVMRLHSEYVQAQMRALAEQASEMGQVVGKAAMDAAKPKPDCRMAESRRLACWNSHPGLNLRRRTRNCSALHKFDMIWVLIGRARGWALP